MNRRRRNVVIILVVGVALFCLPTSWSGQLRSWVKAVISPISSGLYHSSSAVRKYAITIRDLNKLPAENEDLSKQVASLLVENARLKTIDQENAQLKAELKYVSALPNLKQIGAKIIARSALSFEEQVIIDHGSDDGIKAGQPVSVEGALVGKVLSVGAHTADVELITSSTAITQVQLQSSKANGVLRGGISGLTIDYISQDAQVTSGEMVVTSGLGGDVRNGILVGTIVNVGSKKNDIYQTASVKPAININRIDVVFVEVQW